MWKCGLLGGNTADKGHVGAPAETRVGRCAFKPCAKASGKGVPQALGIQFLLHFCKGFFLTGARFRRQVFAFKPGAQAGDFVFKRQGRLRIKSRKGHGRPDEHGQRHKHRCLPF